MCLPRLPLRANVVATERDLKTRLSTSQQLKKIITPSQDLGNGAAMEVVQGIRRVPSRAVSSYPSQLLAIASGIPKPLIPETSGELVAEL